MTIKELAEWIDNEIKDGEDLLAEANKIDINCYGAGFAKGFTDALIRVKLKINNKLDT